MPRPDLPGDLDVDAPPDSSRLESGDKAERLQLVLAGAREALDKSVNLRMPQIPREQGPRARIEALEDYMLATALHEGDLSEARLGVDDFLLALEDEWDHLEGWEAVRQTRTNAGVDDAKRRLRPDLYAAMKAAKYLRRKLSEELERLDRDAKKCSRAYTMATGT